MRRFYPLFLLLFNLMAVHFCKAQDTIFVYEEEVVYDTVYIKSKTEFIKKIKPEKKEISLTQKKKKRISDPLKFGIRFLGGIKSHRFVRTIRDAQNMGYGGGIWFEKQAFNPQFYFLFSADYVFWESNFSLNDENPSSKLTGYYFNRSGKIALFNDFSDEHKEYIGSLRGKWKIDNFSFSGGLNLSYTQFKMAFTTSENGRLIKPLTFINDNLNIGFATSVQFHFQKKLALFLEYQVNSYRQMNFENEEFGQILFEVGDNKIVDRKVLLGISYRFSK